MLVALLQMFENRTSLFVNSDFEEEDVTSPMSRGIVGALLELVVVVHDGSPQLVAIHPLDWLVVGLRWPRW